MMSVGLVNHGVGRNQTITPQRSIINCSKRRPSKGQIHKQQDEWRWDKKKSNPLYPLSPVLCRSHDPADAAWGSMARATSRCSAPFGLSSLPARLPARLLLSHLLLGAPMAYHPAHVRSLLRAESEKEAITRCLRSTLHSSTSSVQHPPRDAALQPPTAWCSKSPACEMTGAGGQLGSLSQPLGPDVQTSFALLSASFCGSLPLRRGGDGGTEYIPIFAPTWPLAGARGARVWVFISLFPVACAHARIWPRLLHLSKTSARRSGTMQAIAAVASAPKSSWGRDGRRLALVRPRLVRARGDYKRPQVQHPNVDVGAHDALDAALAARWAVHAQGPTNL
jgi:hypothetical protein